MNTGTAFLKNTWYVAAWSHEIGVDGMLARTIVRVPVLLWRDSAGKVVALDDRCCHRAAPLSKGRREGDNIRCMYHGLLFDPDGIVEIHQLGAEVPAGQVFDVVRHDGAARGTIGPEPDKGQPLKPLRPHRQREQPLETPVDRSIDRPLWKRNVLPVAQIGALNVPPNRHRQERAQRIVETSRHRAAVKPVACSIAVFSVALVTEVLDDLARLERKAHGAAAGRDIVPDIVERTVRLLAVGSARRAPVTNGLRAKAEKPAIVAELSCELEISDALGTPIVVENRSFRYVH